MTRHIERFWDEASETYLNAQWERNEVTRFDYAATKDALLTHLRPRKTERILEIGCGPGTWTRVVSARCKQITAIDISGRMIGIAKAHCARDNIRFVHTDAVHFSTPERFDKIYAVRSFEYIHDKEGFLNKARTLLKDHGTIVIITKTRPCLWDLIPRVKGFWQEKISHKRLSRLLRKNGFCTIVQAPAILRLPLFAQGNREPKLLSGNHARNALAFFRRLTKRVRGTVIGRAMIPLAESYLVCAKKSPSTQQNDASARGHGKKRLKRRGVSSE